MLGRPAGAEHASADAVATIGDRIVAIGPRSRILELRGADTRVIGDGAIVPGFVDAHLHFLALARRAGEVDCSRAKAATIADVLGRIAAAARERHPGEWIRAFGYDECLLADRRAPTVEELSAAAPVHPLRLLHRTGHAAVLNRAALERLGIDRRDVLHEPAESLRGKIPAPSTEEVEPLAAATSRTLLARGITGFHDLTPGQDATPGGLLGRWVERRVIRQRVVAYGVPASATSSGRDVERYRRGGVKIVVTEASDVEDVAERVFAAERAGEQAALHAVEGAPLVIAVAALSRLGAARVRRLRHRIEHAALCPPALVEEIAASGATVVTHPAFVEDFAAKYRREIPVEQRDWLYPLAAFLRAGIPVALGSDAPICDPRPLATLRGAARRAAADGEDALGAAQAIPVAAALELHTRAAARAGGDDGGGRLAPGAKADLVLLDRDPSACPVERLDETRVLATIVDGEVAWTA